MPRKSREEEILKAIREYLPSAVKSLAPITHARLMKAANCARATYYYYVTKGSAIKLEIEIARAEQKKYVESVKGDGNPAREADLRKRLEVSEKGNRELLAGMARMIANLTTYGVPLELIMKAQREAIPHPDRSFSHAGRGRRRR